MLGATTLSHNTYAMRSFIRMLLIGADAEDQMRLVQSLQHELPDLQATLIAEERELTQALAQGELDFVIANDQLPWADGLTILHSVRSHAPHCPVILFTATGTIERAVEVTKAGADDYIPMTPEYETRLAVAARAALDKARQQHSPAPTLAHQQVIDYLQQQSALFLALAETSPISVFIFQGEYFRYMNAAGAALLGYRLDEFPTMPFWQVIHPDFRELAKERGIARQQGAAVPTQYELKILTKSGEERWVLYTGRMIEVEGKPAVLGTSFDITEHKQAEEKLRASEERYRNWFENANDAIVTLTLDGQVTSVNRGLEAMLGWPREELIGQHYRKFVPPTSVATGEEQTRRFLAGERTPSIFEAEQMRQDGSIVPVEVRTRAIRDKNGKPIGFQGVYRDISARKALERQRADFLAMLTHDIKNPLGVILGYSEMLLEMLQSQGRAEESALVEKLKSSAFTVHSLVNNHLDLSRIEAGAVALAKSPLDLGSLLMRVGRQYEAGARRRQLSFHFSLQDEPITVVGDGVALERVFANLVQNAVKFTPAAGQVTLSLTREKALAIATVADTGPGIAPEEIPSLFEKYQRAKASAAQEGVGLGLFIAKSLVEAHNGHIEVQSVLGHGTSFRVTLPALSQ
ncbi:MAG: PAS domain S-box protein [Deltaproteobacteria bacterium]|nr:PAS domain S-box protein [Deltaproteobacteria bacterium]